MQRTIYFGDARRGAWPRRQRLGATVWLGLILLGLTPAAWSQSTIFSENFEGDFPGARWTVSDLDPAGTPAMWGKVDGAFGGEGTAAGDGKAYCAGMGFLGDEVTPFYLDRMWSVMRTPLDLRGWTNVTITWSFKMPTTEACCDLARASIGSSLFFVANVSTSNWVRVTNNLNAYAGMQQELTFEFKSDFDGTNEGFYVDEILITGTPVADLIADQFSLAIAVGTLSGRFAGNNAAATHEVGEPDHAGGGGSHSIWYCFTAPATRPFVFSTYGSSFDTVLGIYTGNAVDALTLVGANDNGEPVGAGSRVSFDATSNQVYYIAVDGKAGAAGSFILGWAPLTNDFFIAAPVITTGAGTLTGNNTGYGFQTAEPLHLDSRLGGFNLGGRSAWHRFIAPAAGRYFFRTTGSLFNTLLAVHRGVHVAGLLPVVDNNDETPLTGPGTSKVAFEASAGEELWVAVDGRRSTTTGVISSGAYTLSWGPDDNDSFVLATPISGSSGTLDDSNVNDTSENGEPLFCGNDACNVLLNGRSIWYRWTAPSSGIYTFDTAGSVTNGGGMMDTVLIVWTGLVQNVTSVEEVDILVGNDDAVPGADLTSRVEFEAQAGVTYWISVNGWGNEAGATFLNWSRPPAPDLIVHAPSVNPTLETRVFAPNDCEVLEGTVRAGKRRLLRFTTEVRNAGTIDLSLGDPNGNPLFGVDLCAGQFVLNGAANYRLLSGVNAAASRLNRPLCFQDSVSWDAGAPPDPMFDCNALQGLQRGWSSIADGSLPGQYIDVTGLPGGNYTLEIRIDPGGAVDEIDEDNNVVQVPVTITFDGTDQFADALPAAPRITANTTAATKEADEPNHAGNSGGHSVWFCWTAPPALNVTIDTFGSSFDTLLAVYTGSSVGSLTPVAANDNASGMTTQSRVSFVPTEGTLYFIAVDGANGASGGLVLNLLADTGHLQLSLDAGGELIVTLYGVPGRTYTLEESPDLQTWSPLFDVLANLGPTEVPLGPPAANGVRFYRAVLP